MKQTETLKALWSRWKYAALIAAAGAALLLLPAGGGRTDAAPAAETEERVQDTVREMETRMEAILKTIDGTGELHLMLAADTGTARQLAQDTELSYSGAVSAPDDYLRREETVLTGSGAGDLSFAYQILTDLSVEETFSCFDDPTMTYCHALGAEVDPAEYDEAYSAYFDGMTLVEKLEFTALGSDPVAAFEEAAGH